MTANKAGNVPYASLLYRTVSHTPVQVIRNSMPLSKFYGAARRILRAVMLKWNYNLAPVQRSDN